jgi:hypothetical protein
MHIEDEMVKVWGEEEMGNAKIHHHKAYEYGWTIWNPSSSWYHSALCFGGLTLR